MLAQRRHERILERLRADGPAEVATLAQMLGVSDATVRRDLAHLETGGMLTRVHGGASLSSSPEPPFEQAAGSHLEPKREVARRAVELVDDGDVLLLDIGTTTHQIAAHLHGRSVTVITSSLAVYEELAHDPVVELILLGGVVRRNYRSMVGFLTEHAISQIHADKLFLGTSGIRRNGAVLDTTVIEVPVKQAMLAAADQVLLVADGAKFPGSGLARVCGAADIDVLVTAHDADPSALTAFKEAGTRVELTAVAAAEPDEGTEG